ncbi:hypothetical protein L211DRAFT_857301 [Terfezia boudieri ATCC MYA-4762]|uniref:RRM domain-containing protein n=1 Tax=Terfezia boudieri ATCC MYA-4762 TaxID=1051890 RepID=A0A3N4LN45_9PEZI|nr:hypothetical protein L211DRAFT_857301 [Terfezia boudieri ATCC MYA-4762]
MDKSLDEVVRERQHRGDKNRRGPRGGNSRDRGERAGSGGAWVHDRYDEDQWKPRTRLTSNLRNRPPGAARLRVENLHYELGQEDLTSLFNRIAPTLSVQLKYDRAGRSEGIAYVTYERERDARHAIDEFDGANAHGQPIRLSIISSSAASFASNPNVGRSLFERVERPRSLSPVDRARDRNRERVRPSGRGSKIDRYVPEERDRVRERERRDRPIVDRGDGGRDRKRDGDRRRGDRGRRGGNGSNVGGGGAGTGEGKTSGSRRPRKTIEELDEEMSNYWNETAGEAGGEQEQNGAAVGAGTAPVMDDDMMIE